MELGELNINVTASYTEGRWTGSVNACIFACLILFFTVLLLNGELGYYFLCAVQICACLVRWQRTW